MQVKMNHGTYKNCHLLFGQYSNKRIAIQIQYKDMPLMKATVNLPAVEIEPGEILIKNYAENEGVLQALIDAGVIEDTDKFVKAGYSIANVCKLLIDPDTYDKRADAERA